MVSVVPRLAPGSTFAERFRIEAYVGQGSMGSVYRALQVGSGAVVALKILKLDAAREPRALRRFQREAESGARIVSPHVARTLDSGTLAEGGLAWIAMEFAEGDDLQELLRRRGRLELAEAQLVLSQVFSALSVAHAAGIVHRDLKPENLRVSTQGGALSVKVLDFGIAKAVDDDISSVTTPGLGTPLWTAPEQAREGYAPLPNADVWALGLLTFFALTGSQYWKNAGERASLADLAIELLKSEIEPAAGRARELGSEVELPAGFDAWFERAVQREPEQRFRDAAEAWRALEPLLTRSPADESPERWGRGPTDKRARWGRGPTDKRARWGRSPTDKRARWGPTDKRNSGPTDKRNSGPTDKHKQDRPGPLLARPAAFLTLVILSWVAVGLAIFWLLRSARI